MKKKLLSLIAAAALILSGISASAAESKDGPKSIKPLDTHAVSEKLDTITSNLSEAVPLDEEQISSLVEYQIDTYMTTEQFANDKDIIPGSEDTWVPLYDLEGNHFADMVPLVDNGNGEVGYITMGAIEDGFTQYMMAWDTSLLNALRDALQQEPGSQAVFFPPMDYGIQYGQGAERRIYRFNMGNYSLVDVTANIAENAEDVSKQYQIIRSSENAEKTELALSNATRVEAYKAHGIPAIEENATETLNRASYPKEDVRLSCEWKSNYNFVIIVDPVTYERSYGGNQNWYNEQSKRNNGCGPVAAANIMYYMSTLSDKYKNLYPHSNKSKAEFLKFMNTMYSVINPSAAGEFYYENFANDLTNWAKKQGVTVIPRTQSYTYGANSTCASFIKGALNDDKPVASLNVDASAYYDPSTGVKLNWHWITITKYFQDNSGNRWVAVSSWGDRYSIDWNAYWASCNSTGGGLVRF